MSSHVTGSHSDTNLLPSPHIHFDCPVVPFPFSSLQSLVRIQAHPTALSRIVLSARGLSSAQSVLSMYAGNVKLFDEQVLPLPTTSIPDTDHNLFRHVRWARLLHPHSSCILNTKMRRSPNIARDFVFTLPSSFLPSLLGLSHSPQVMLCVPQPSTFY